MALVDDLPPAYTQILDVAVTQPSPTQSETFVVFCSGGSVSLWSALIGDPDAGGGAEWDEIDVLDFANPVALTVTRAGTETILVATGPGGGLHGASRAQDDATWVGFDVPAPPHLAYSAAVSAEAGDLVCVWARDYLGGVWSVTRAAGVWDTAWVAVSLAGGPAKVRRLAAGTGTLFALDTAGAVWANTGSVWSPVPAQVLTGTGPAFADLACSSDAATLSAVGTQGEVWLKTPTAGFAAVGSANVMRPPLACDARGNVWLVGDFNELWCYAGRWLGPAWSGFDVDPLYPVVDLFVRARAGGGVETGLLVDKAPNVSVVSQARSTDEDTWNAVSAPVQLMRVCAAADGTSLLGLDSTGTIYTSSGEDEQWTAVTTPAKTDAVFATNPGGGRPGPGMLVHTGDGTVLECDDATGAQWVTIFDSDWGITAADAVVQADGTSLMLVLNKGRNLLNMNTKPPPAQSLWWDWWYTPVGGGCAGAPGSYADVALADLSHTRGPGCCRVVVLDADGQLFVTESVMGQAGPHFPGWSGPRVFAQPVSALRVFVSGEDLWLLDTATRLWKTSNGGATWEGPGWANTALLVQDDPKPDQVTTLSPEADTENGPAAGPAPGTVVSTDRHTITPAPAPEGDLSWSFTSSTAMDRITAHLGKNDQFATIRKDGLVASGSNGLRMNPRRRKLDYEITAYPPQAYTPAPPLQVTARVLPDHIGSASGTGYTLLVRPVIFWTPADTPTLRDTYRTQVLEGLAWLAPYFRRQLNMRLVQRDLVEIETDAAVGVVKFPPGTPSGAAQGFLVSNDVTQQLLSSPAVDGQNVVNLVFGTALDYRAALDKNASVPRGLSPASSGLAGDPDTGAVFESLGPRWPEPSQLGKALGHELGHYLGGLDHVPSAKELKKRPATNAEAENLMFHGATTATFPALLAEQKSSITESVNAIRNFVQVPDNDVAVAEIVLQTSGHIPWEPLQVRLSDDQGTTAYVITTDLDNTRSLLLRHVFTEQTPWALSSFTQLHVRFLADVNTSDPFTSSTWMLSAIDVTFRNSRGQVLLPRRVGDGDQYGPQVEKVYNLT